MGEMVALAYLRKVIETTDYHGLNGTVPMPSFLDDIAELSQFGFVDCDSNHLATAKSPSFFLPPLSAATSHRGLLPLPAQVSLGFAGLRNFGVKARRLP